MQIALKKMRVHLQLHLPKEKKQSPKVTCDAPGCTFATRLPNFLQQHKLNVHNLNNLECQLCGLLLKSYSCKKSHLMRHRTPTDGLVRCVYRQCNKILPETELKQHFEQHVKAHKQSTFQCEYCGRFLAKKSLLVLHRERHLKKSPGLVICLNGGCKYFCSTSTELRQHMDEHTKNQHQFLCLKCVNYFPSESELKQHMQMHCVNQNTPDANQPEVTNCDFRCQFCGSIFLCAATLAPHLRRHQTEKPGVWKCVRKNCQQLFTCATELKEHSDTHKLEKFKCETCGILIASVFELKRHMLRHLQPRSFDCDVPGCSYGGKRRVDILKHKKYEHENPGRDCQFCRANYKNATDFKLHVKRHQTSTPGFFKCILNECKRTRFSSPQEVQNHMLTHKAEQTVYSVSNSLPAIENAPHQRTFF